MNTPVGFVGRESELRILGDRLAAARKGNPQVVYVEGEAGAGAGGLADPGWAQFVGGDARVTQMGLGGLSPADLTELAGVLGLGALSQRRASRLTARRDCRPQR
jgi:hypothetical protein